MINAIKAREWMPSTLKRQELRKKRLEEISALIERAARNDQDSIFINIYDYEKSFLLDTLKDRGFTVIDYPETRQGNATTGECRIKYKISW